MAERSHSPEVTENERDSEPKQTRGTGEPCQGLQKLLELSRHLGEQEAIPIARAAKIANVTPKTIRKWAANRFIETLLRNGRKHVTVRSLEARLRSEYRASERFNLFREDWKKT